MNPEEAVQIHQDINSHFSVGILSGTYLLTDESMDEPPKRLVALLEKMEIPEDKF